MRIAQDLSISRVRKAGKASRSPARPSSPGVDLAARGWGPTVVTRANVASLFPGVPDSGWPLPLAKSTGWQNGGKIVQKGAKLRLFGEKATLLVMAQLLYCHVVALIFVERAPRGE